MPAAVPLRLCSVFWTSSLNLTYTWYTMVYNLEQLVTVIIIIINQFSMKNGRRFISDTCHCQDSIETI